VAQRPIITGASQNALPCRRRSPTGRANAIKALVRRPDSFFLSGTGQSTQWPSFAKAADDRGLSINPMTDRISRSSSPGGCLIEPTETEIESGGGTVSVGRGGAGGGRRQRPDPLSHSAAKTGAKEAFQGCNRLLAPRQTPSRMTRARRAQPKPPCAYCRKSRRSRVFSLREIGACAMGRADRFQLSATARSAARICKRNHAKRIASWGYRCVARTGGLRLDRQPAQTAQLAAAFGEVSYQYMTGRLGPWAVSGPRPQHSAKPANSYWCSTVSQTVCNSSSLCFCRQCCAGCLGAGRTSPASTKTMTATGRAKRARPIYSRCRTRLPPGRLHPRQVEASYKTTTGGVLNICTGAAEENCRLLPRSAPLPGVFMNDPHWDRGP